MTASPAVGVVRVPMVRPPRAHVATGIAPLRGQPREDAELVDEAQFGEPLTVLGEDRDWWYVQGPDLYFGWIERSRLAAATEPDRSVVAVALAPIRAATDGGAPVLDALPAGTVLDRADGDWIAAGAGWVSAADCVRASAIPHRYPNADDLLATAEAYLGAPYLWGGTTVRGIDCSGLTQQVYRLNGVGLDRDADQQALGGRAADRARPGDLLFFGAERVTHVALATGERTFIHAPQKGGSVERGELSGERRLRAIRRYLP